jgi:hypothetical protein
MAAGSENVHEPAAGSGLFGKNLSNREQLRDRDENLKLVEPLLETTLEFLQYRNDSSCDSSRKLITLNMTTRS